MKVFRKTALLISVIVLAVVLAVGAVAGAAQLSEGNTTLGEVQSAVQVTTDGKVNLKVYYSSLGKAEAFVATVTDPVTNETVPYNYSLENLGEDANGKYVKVPLAPSQMTHTVRVWATAENGEKASDFVYETTVVDYANRVLADPDNANYHDAMRALLNWGAMAQTKFNDATTVPANTGLFERNTNSINGVNTITYEKGEVTQGTTITGKEMNLSLDPGNIVLHFYVNYTGSGTLTATVSKDGGEAVDTDITNTANGWHVTVANVPATMFDTPYTVTVTDGTNTFTATKTIREYLGTLLAQCIDNGDLATGNTVRALYQFYQILTGKTGAADCAHNQKYYYWVADGADTSSVRCNHCHTVLGTGISNDVNAYAHAGTLQNVSTNGQVDKTLMTENGVQFVRYDNFYANRDNWGDISLHSTFTGVEGVTGQYMVIKYRTSAEGNSKTTLETYSNTNKGGVDNLAAKGQADIVMSKDDQWHTVIINLAERVKDPSITFVDEGDGTYNVRYLSIRAFAGSSKVDTDDAEGRYAYTYTNAAGTKYTVYGEKLTEEQMAEKGYTELVQINKASVSPDAYLDLAYVALCDSEAEAKSLIDTAVYEKSTANDKSLYLNTADNSCTQHAIAEVVDGTTHTIKCTVCGEIVRTFEVPADINYYADRSIMTHYGSTVTKNLYDEEAKIFYNKFYAAGGCHFDITGGSEGTAGSWTTEKYNSGKYVVIKYRSTVNENMNVGTKDKGTRPDKNPLRTSVGTLTASANWKVQVFEIPDDCASYTVNSEQELYFMVGNNAGTFDIAYLAVVDNVTEATLLLGEGETYYDKNGVEYDKNGTPVVAE